MLIDWFTVGAQLLNFGVLVWLLKRFLYKPILDAIDQREQHVAAALADADAKQAAAQRERDDFRDKNEAFDREREALLDQAAKDADDERERLLDAARQAADALQARRRQALQDDAQRLDQAVAQRTQQEVFAIARQALAELADASLEERLADVLLRRLRALDGPARQAMAEALAANGGRAVVRSAFELPAAQRAAIRAAIDARFSIDSALQFEAAAPLVAGIELIAGGHKLAWSIADRLASLQQGVVALLAQAPPSAPAPQTVAAGRAER